MIKQAQPQLDLKRSHLWSKFALLCFVSLPCGQDISKSNLDRASGLICIYFKYLANSYLEYVLNYLQSGHALSMMV